MATSKPVEERLPDLEDGELAEVMGLKVVEKTTRPPAHYTEASLLEDMMSAGKFIENDPALRKALKVVSGLGTAATRAATIEGLKNDRYLEKSGKSITATPKGIALIQWLEGIAPELTDVAVTARWEAELAVVAVTGGGAAFEANVVEMVKTLIARLKTAPAMSLAPPSTTSPKETSRMSETTGERSSAPTPRCSNTRATSPPKWVCFCPKRQPRALKLARSSSTPTRKRRCVRAKSSSSSQPASQSVRACRFRLKCSPTAKSFQPGLTPASKGVAPV